ncbi:NADPH:quinone reductase-like Zn-dependent oxidoreductase [Pelomonas saccharophila]|uniref:NADPH:quinone reductase-like Zn-dependent oxidoreductase n=1 Tax=Roseateles saccharophilus TaxID=304 RepID=A0ABU1YPU1_ROSSA|nr:NADP-dependent oxidoreductase [Roseateles saccharophilus]MDR7270874.1 NADPH:quinone reductase-like Zn-dependent oxidoreductase [Roseateles saccharophilus]
MKTVRALTLQTYGGPEATRLSAVPAPTAGPGQVLVSVRAAGLNALDWKVREGLVRDAFPLALPAVLGLELAGVVEAIGAGVTRLRPGDRVMGPLGRLGAYAELVAVDEARLALTPAALTDVAAAALPVAAMAGWQSLYFAGPVWGGQRVLVHGAAGALGRFAVQFAKRAGAFVVATAAGRDVAALRALGVDQVIDHETQRFEELVSDIHLVLDYVGGEVLERTWPVVAKGGVVVGTSSPEILTRTPAGQRGLWFVMTPDAALLARLAQQVARGELQAPVGQVLPLADLPAAIERHRTGALRGKTVIDFTA